MIAAPTALLRLVAHGTPALQRLNACLSTPWMAVRVCWMPSSSLLMIAVVATQISVFHSLRSPLPPSEDFDVMLTRAKLNPADVRLSAPHAVPLSAGGSIQHDSSSDKDKESENASVLSTFTAGSQSGGLPHTTSTSRTLKGNASPVCGFSARTMSCP